MIDARLLEVARRVEADVDTAGWDQPPRLFGVVPTYEVLEVPDFPRLTGRGGHPVAALQALAGMGRRLQYQVPRQLWPLVGLRAWVLTHEGWLVEAKPVEDPLGTSQLLAQAVGRQLHARPDRVEVRGVHVVGRDDGDSLFRRRGQDGLRTMAEWFNADDGWTSGAVLTALTQLMAATPA